MCVKCSDDAENSSGCEKAGTVLRSKADVLFLFPSVTNSLPSGNQYPQRGLNFRTLLSVHSHTLTHTHSMHVGDAGHFVYEWDAHTHIYIHIMPTYL